jgi:hypothetical protein
MATTRHIRAAIIQPAPFLFFLYFQLTFVFTVKFSQRKFLAASFSHFFMKDVLAAPAKGLPFFPTALASHPESAAKAMLTTINDASNTAMMCLM